MQIAQYSFNNNFGRTSKFVTETCHWSLQAIYFCKKVVGFDLCNVIMLLHFHLQATASMAINSTDWKTTGLTLQAPTPQNGRTNRKGYPIRKRTLTWNGMSYVHKFGTILNLSMFGSSRVSTVTYVTLVL